MSQYHALICAERSAQQALEVDSLRAGFLGKLRGRAAESAGTKEIEMQNLLDELQQLISNYEKGTREERQAVAVLACLRGALLSGASSELSEMCVEFSKYQITLLRQKERDILAVGRKNNINHAAIDVSLEEVEQQLDDLVNLYSEIRITSPRSLTASIVNNRGLLYLEMKEYESAEKAFLRAIEIEPEFIEAYRNLGSLHQELSNYTKAEEYLEQAKYLDATLPKYVLKPENRQEFRESLRKDAERIVRERKLKARQEEKDAD